VLRKVAKKVHPEELTDPLFQQLIDDMYLTMYEAPGIGLAAPQVSVSKRVFVVDLQDGDDSHGPFEVINPKFTVTEGEVESSEGCLSVPAMIGELPRFERVTCVGIDRRGQKVEHSGTGLFARCLQHEMHHLDGTLYVDLAKDVRPVESDRPGSEGDRPGSEGDRPGSEGDRPGSEGDRPGSEGDRPGSEGDRPGSEGDRAGSEGATPDADVDAMERGRGDAAVADRGDSSPVSA